MLARTQTIRRREVEMVTRFEELPLMTRKQLASATVELVNSIRRSISTGCMPVDKVDGHMDIWRDHVFPNICKG